MSTSYTVAVVSNLDKLSLSKGGTFFVDHVLYELVCDDQSILTMVPKMPSGLLMGKQRCRLLHSCKDVVEKREAIWNMVAENSAAAKEGQIATPVTTTGCDRDDSSLDKSTLPSLGTKMEEQLKLK
jgi:hypothetical protein